MSDSDSKTEKGHSGFNNEFETPRQHGRSSDSDSIVHDTPGEIRQKYMRTSRMVGDTLKKYQKTSRKASSN